MTPRRSKLALLAGLALLAAPACESESSPSPAGGGQDAATSPDPGGGGQPTGTLAAFCSGVGTTGCCEGSRLLWCEAGQAVAIECATNGCGWDAEGGFYNCYNTGADPGGAPIACPQPAAGACVPSCSGRCGGDDGCGGTCRCSDLIGQSCVGGVCAKDATPTECETVAHVGCCEGNTRRYCSGGRMGSQSCDGGCGWTAQGWYDCGGSGADPSGVWPAACP